MDIGGGKRLVSIPYSYEINDSPFLYTRNGTIDQFVAAIKRQFDTLYAEGAQSGRVMAICLHPYLIGVPHRIQGLAEALDYIAAHDGVWFATGEEIVRAWLGSGATFCWQRRGFPFPHRHLHPSLSPVTEEGYAS